VPPGATQTAGWVEYPVGIGAVKWLAAQPAHDSDEFLVVTALMLAAAALATAWLLRPTGRRAYLFAASPLLVLYAFHNWDLLPVAATVAAAVAWRNGRHGAAGALLGLGGIAKVYPLLLVPAFMAERVRHGDRRGAAVLAAAAAAIVIVANAPVALINEAGWRTPFTFQSNRPADINSIWAWLPHHLTVSHLNLVTAALTAALVVAAVVCVGRGVSPVATGAAIVAGTIAVGKVASPQYALWVVPFFSLLNVRTGWWLLFTVSELVFWTAFFVQGYFGVHGSGYVEPAVFMRALVLGLLIPVFLRSGDLRGLSPIDPGRSVQLEPSQ
jgi:uncharacterized membrane protein